MARTAASVFGSTGGERSSNSTFTQQKLLDRDGLYPRVKSRLLVYVARWMGFKPVYTVCINREWSIERRSLTS